MTWVTGKIFIFYNSWILETINLATWKMCSCRGTTSHVLCTVINLTTSGLHLLCCPTFIIRVSGNISVGAGQMSVWYFCHLFAYTGLQCVCSWSQHHSASKGRKEAGLGMGSSLTARASKKTPSVNMKKTLIHSNIQLEMGVQLRVPFCIIQVVTDAPVFLELWQEQMRFSLQLGCIGIVDSQVLVIANWCYKCNSPHARLSIHSGTSLGQVNSQYTLPKVRVRSQARGLCCPRRLGLPESQNGDVRWENTWRRLQGEIEE